jgi:hypothetical protein
MMHPRACPMARTARKPIHAPIVLAMKSQGAREPAGNGGPPMRAKRSLASTQLGLTSPVKRGIAGKRLQTQIPAA